MVVLHYTGMADARAALARLCDPAAEVSAHYLIDEAGEVVALVDEARRAWHAGVASWGGVRDVNSRSIGIELVNPGLGAGAHPFPLAQMRALERVLGGVTARYEVPPERVVGHACVAPGRKVDPGPRFDWRALAVAGLSVWPAVRPAPRRPHPPTRARGAGRGSAARFRAAAATFGYGIEPGEAWDAPARAVWQAFALRFCPWLSDAPGEPSALAMLEELAARWPVAVDSPAPAR